MARRLALLLLIGASCFPRGWNRADPTIPETMGFPFTAGPYLVRMDQHQTAVALRAPLAEAPTLEWWAVTSTTAPPERKNKVTFDSRSGGLWAAVMSDVPHDVQIAYEVHSSAGDAGPLTFRQGVSRGTAFRFAAFGDTRSGHQVHRLLVDAIAKEDVDFVINSGDLVEFGGYDDQWMTFFRIEAPLASHAFLYPVVGNHDDSPQRLFERYFLTELYARGTRYYVQDFGDVRFVAMDSEVEISRDSTQWNFIESNLKEGAEKDMIMVLSLHRPPYSSGTHGSELGFRALVDELAIKYGVELVLAGHDHDYERTKPIRGTTHIVAASAGANIRPVGPSDFTEVLRTEPHFVILDVDGKSLTGRTINLAGETFDTFVIEPNPPGGRP